MLLSSGADPRREALRLAREHRAPRVPGGRRGEQGAATHRAEDHAGVGNHQVPGPPYRGPVALDELEQVVRPLFEEIDEGPRLDVEEVLDEERLSREQRERGLGLVGDGRRAVAGLEEGIAACDGAGLRAFAGAARVRLGRVTGRDSIREEGEARLVRCGVSAPERFTAMLVPGW